MADGCLGQALVWDGSLFESALTNVADAVVVTDGHLDPPGPEIVYVNPAFCRMTGYAQSELIGRTPRMLQGVRTERSVLSDLRASLEAGQVFVGGTELSTGRQRLRGRVEYRTCTHVRRRLAVFSALGLRTTGRLGRGLVWSRSGCVGEHPCTAV